MRESGEIVARQVTGQAQGDSAEEHDNSNKNKAPPLRTTNSSTKGTKEAAGGTGS
jgi:hypothetical protein